MDVWADAARSRPERLRHIGERFRVGFDDAAIGMSVTRLDGSYLRVNRAFCELVGRDRETLLQMRLQDLTHPDDVQTADERTAEAMERDEPSVLIDKRYVHSNGRVIDVQVATAFMCDDDGQPAYFFTQVLDVTQLVAARRSARDGQRRLERIIGSVPAAYLEIERDGTIRAWNRAAEDLLGWRAEEAVGADYATILSPDSAGAAHERLRVLQEHMAGDRVVERIERSLRHRDGHLIVVEATIWTTGEADDATLYAFLEDVTERRQAEDALAEAEERWRLALDAAPTGIALVGMDGHIVRVNEALCRIVGYSEEELLATTFQEISVPDDQPVSYEMLRRMRAGEIARFTMEKRYRHADGHAVWVNLSVALARDSRGEPLHMVTHVEDITDRRARTQALQDAALRDPLTTLANRARFLTELDRAVVNATPQTPLGVLFLDLDGFKAVNDTYGHACGDELLTQIGQRLENAVRGRDLAARLGGDEFALLLPSVVHPEDVETIAARVLASFAAPFTLAAGAHLEIGASIGGAVATERSGTGSALLARADAAMYEAKRRGKNTYVIG